jgi:hypothetical protein
MAFVRRQRQNASVNYSESHRAERSKAQVAKACPNSAEAISFRLWQIFKCVLKPNMSLTLADMRASVQGCIKGCEVLGAMFGAEF